MTTGGPLQSPFLGTAAATAVVAHDTLASTNAEALRLGGAGETGPLWITAVRQTAGRGRRGRTWASRSGNLHASLLVTLWWPLPDLTNLSLVAAVGLAEALTTLQNETTDARSPADIRLKWPNDILIDGAKSAGILVETTRGPKGGTVAVIGVGVNVAAAPDVADQAVTALATHGLVTTPDDVLLRLDAALRRAFMDLQRGDGRERLRQAWMARATPPGTRITVKDNHGRLIAGRFAGLADDGSLLLEDETGCLRSICHGDVSAQPHVV